MTFGRSFLASARAGAFAIVIVSTVSGCAPEFAQDDSEHDIAVASEYCRAIVESLLGRHADDNERANDTPHSAFGRRYRACMANKGFSVPRDMQ